jgi:hypothetical protein
MKFAICILLYWLILTLVTRTNGWSTSLNTPAVQKQNSSNEHCIPHQCIFQIKFNIWRITPASVELYLARTWCSVPSVTASITTTTRIRSTSTLSVPASKTRPTTTGAAMTSAVPQSRWTLCCRYGFMIQI